MDERGGSKDHTPKPPAPVAPLKQIRETAEVLLKEGKISEAEELYLAALEAVLVKNRELELLLAKYRHQKLPHKSERVDPNQLWLLVETMADLPGADQQIDIDAEAKEDAQITGEVDTAESVQPPLEGKKRRNAGDCRSRGIEQREHRVEADPADRTCAKCGKEKRSLGSDATRRFEYVAAHFVEHVYHLEKLACGTCKDDVTTAPAPPQVIERSPVGASLLAHLVIINKMDHLPLHRISRAYARDGVEIAVSTLADWIAAAGKLVEPLVDRLARRVLKATVVRTDATGLLVLDSSTPENAVRGSIWCYVGDDRDVVFKYTQTGEGETGPWKFLAGREGYVQADAHSVFDRLFNGEVASAIEVGCLAHARRHLIELQDTDCRVAYPLRLIARIYRLEYLADLRRLTPTDRTGFRRERILPQFEKLKRWFAATFKAEPPSSALCKAVAYSLHHWDALTRFVDDGRLSPDNNLCERQLRDIACGRKNYLFAGSHDAARRAASLYSLTRTCLQHKVPPLPYFTDVFTKLGKGWSGDRLEQLLPHAWRPPL
jgi:transposase